jgi:FMN phosphatase YigB (HAD superfamily)
MLPEEVGNYMRGIFFDINGLVYGPTGGEFLSEVLRAESIMVDAHQVTDALARLPGELQAARHAMRTEEQENDYYRAMLPALLAAVGVADPTDALLMRLLEAIHQYSAYFSMYPETLPVLEELKWRGYVMAVVSDWAPSLARFVREFELDGYFRAVLPCDQYHVALERTGLAAADTFYVSPGLHLDLAAAARAGLTPIWVNRTGISTGHEVLTVTDLRGLLILAPKAGDEPCN